METTQPVEQVQTSRAEFIEVLQRAHRAERYVEAWHKNIDKWRRLYDQKHYGSPAKPKETQYNDPTFTNTVDLAVGIMLGNELRWHAYGFSPSKNEQVQTGKIEKLIAGTLEINSEREEKHLLYNLFLNFDRDGGGVLYSVFDPAIASRVSSTAQVVDESAEGGVVIKHKFYEVPLRTMVVDPRRFICLPGGPRRWLMMGIKEQRSVLDVEMQYGFKAKNFATLSQEEKSSTRAVFYNLWDYVYVEGNPTVRNTIVFDNEPVRGPRPMPGYDELPLTVQFFKPLGDDADEWHNIMVPLESSVALLERSFNRRSYQIDVFTGLPLVIKTQPGRTTKIDPGLYHSINISPDEDIAFPKWPGTPPDVQMQVDFLRSRIQQSGFSDIMFGSGPNQVAGYAISQLGDQNRIRLEQPIQHLELLLTTWAKKQLRLLAHFAPDSIICVYGRQRGRDYRDEVDLSEISGFSVRAEIRPNYPNEESRKVAMSTQTKDTLSDYTRMEKYLNIQQPEDEQKRKIIEATVRHPIALQYAITAELKTMADGGDEIAALTLQSIANQGLPGTEGRPKEPNNPEQFVGTTSPTGLPTEQEQGGQPPGQSEQDQMDRMAGAAPGLME